MQELETKKIIDFIQQLWQKNHKQPAVIAVSGGIDSALALTLATQALGPQNIFPAFLPYGDQDITDSQLICDFNHIPAENIKVINIQDQVDSFAIKDQLRLANVKARVRMIYLFDLAKEKDALVVGTENKSEHYLGYFTRFGDAASDVEPIAHLSKTQVRQMAEFLQLPSRFLDKAPSAGLWLGQTDEEELGFTYREADLVIEAYLHDKLSELKLDKKVVEKILTRIENNKFKREVPYQLNSDQ